jgi:hypothetical protein
MVQHVNEYLKSDNALWHVAKAISSRFSFLLLPDNCVLK